MTRWRMTMIEPTLDDLFDDDLMRDVMRSARTNAAEVRAILAESARRRGLAGPFPAPCGATPPQPACC